MSHYVIRQGGKGRLGFIKNRDSDGLDEGDLTSVGAAEKFTEEEAHAWVAAHKGRWAPHHEVIGPIGSDKDFDDEQRDQDPHRHKGLSDFEAEQRDQDPFRHEDEETFDSTVDKYLK